MRRGIRRPGGTHQARIPGLSPSRLGTLSFPIPAMYDTPNLFLSPTTSRRPVGSRPVSEVRNRLIRMRETRMYPVGVGSKPPVLEGEIASVLREVSQSDMG